MTRKIILNHWSMAAELQVENVDKVAKLLFNLIILFLYK